MENKKYSCAIFDLDGVLVDTAKYHYLAWKSLADELGFDFTIEQNEALKGVSRMKSLDFLLGFGGLSDRFSQEEKEKMADKKNRIYVEMIKKLKKEELFGGVTDLFVKLKEKNMKTALGSASKNAPLILERLDIAKYFDAVVDGTQVSKAKPDPEVFVRAAEILHIPCKECIVFEDSAAGLQAAKTAGMKAVGIGKKENLPMADLVIGSVDQYIPYL
ncbi:MAG TPA: beta-phosphoglucomutase [Candidatus Mediterraneibacter stercoripullorum]|nr:beta-phosphoglucomutase [Candidatus Mediterraneibacter stercoripullorum]